MYTQSVKDKQGLLHLQGQSHHRGPHVCGIVSGNMKVFEEHEKLTFYLHIMGFLKAK